MRMATSAPATAWGRVGELLELTKFPDYFFLLCAHACEESREGGGNFLIDGYEILRQLDADPETRWVTSALEQRPVNQTSRLPSVTPVLLRTAGDRPGSMGGWVEDAQMLELYHGCIQRAQDAAERVYLRPGDALIVDNYRSMDARYQAPAVALLAVDRRLAGAATSGGAALDAGEPPGRSAGRRRGERQRGKVGSETGMGGWMVEGQDEAVPKRADEAPWRHGAWQGMAGARLVAAVAGSVGSQVSVTGMVMLHDMADDDEPCSYTH
eukprot:Skav221146  [mRNA]  locus=scaffold2925:86815:93701:+ [translate_table: standard]